MVQLLLMDSVGMDQPDSIQLDFADQMTVDSVKYLARSGPTTTRIDK